VPTLSLSAGDLIASALRLDQVLASGEQPSAEEAQDSLLSLNAMLDSWNSERLMCFTITIAEYPLTVGKQVYTLGVGGDFNADRPARIDRISIVSLLNPAQPLELPVEYLTDAQWQEIPVKLISSTLPLQVYDDQAFPLRNLTFRYIPQIPVNTRIYSWTALSLFPDLTTAFTLPPAYSKALRYALALELAPEFGVTPQPAVVAQAIQAISLIKRMNQPLVDLRCDSALVGTGDKRIYNWLTDNAIGR
jgi:hypothetical protein